MAESLLETFVEGVSLAWRRLTSEVVGRCRRANENGLHVRLRFVGPLRSQAG